MKAKIRNVMWVVAIILIEVAFVSYQRTINAPIEDLNDANAVDYWEVFAGITKERRYIEEAGAHYRIPIFTPDLLELSGKEIKIRGYYLPFSKSDSAIIISKYPNASCFYCGLAGIESVAMVELGKKKPTYRIDQRLAVNGKLMLNSTDVGKLAFVLIDASVEEL